MAIQNSINLNPLSVGTYYKDSANLDSFSRLRVSNPVALFSNQFTYDISPLVFEQIVIGTGASVAHDATKRCALMTFSNTPTGGSSYMQSYEYIQYQPGKSQLVFVTFNMVQAVANCLKFAGLGDSSNGFFFENNGTTNQVKIYSSTGSGNQTATQANWNLDTLDGSGNSNNPSGILLNISACNIMVLDFQALYVGRCRFGFDINGSVVYCHEFLNANIITLPYIATANLPIKCGMTCSASVTTTMNFICCSVSSEGGRESTSYYTFATQSAITAANGTDTYALSIRPKTTFNGLTNRAKYRLVDLNFQVSGNSGIFWKLCIGQTLTTPTFTDVNTTYSGMQVDTTGTLSGSPLIVIDQGYSSSGKVSTSQNGQVNYPITLNEAGSTRTLGTYTLICQGIGGNSAMNATMMWSEER